jgi:hypothetical protein
MCDSADYQSTRKHYNPLVQGMVAQLSGSCSRLSGAATIGSRRRGLAGAHHLAPVTSHMCTVTLLWRSVCQRSSNLLLLLL